MYTQRWKTSGSEHIICPAFHRELTLSAQHFTGVSKPGLESKCILLSLSVRGVWFQPHSYCEDSIRQYRWKTQHTQPHLKAMWFTEVSFVRGISWAQWIFSQESRAFSWFDPATKSHNPGPGEKKKISHTWGKQCGLGHEPHPWHFGLWKFQQVHCLSWPGKVRRPWAPAWWRQPQGGKRMPFYQITILTSCHSSAQGPWLLFLFLNTLRTSCHRAFAHAFPLPPILLFLISRNPGFFQLSDSSSKFTFPWPPSLR